MNATVPGPTATPILHHSDEVDDTVVQRPSSPYVTDQILSVDGGLSVA